MSCYRQKVICSQNDVDLTNVNLSDYISHLPRLCRCGRCPDCFKARVNSYVVRSYFEFSYSQYPCYFIGLSLHDIYFNSNWRPFRYFELFRDRFRKKYGFFPSYLISYEFGKKNTHRLHYHLCFYDCPIALFEDELLSVWQYGLVFIGDYFDIRSVLYGTKYLGKGILEDFDNSLDMLRNIRTSVGFGLSNNNPLLISSIRELLLSESLLSIGNKVFSIPRFYRLRCLSESERFLLFLKTAIRNDSYFVRIGDKIYDIFDPTFIALNAERWNSFITQPNARNLRLYENFLIYKNKESKINYGTDN